LTQADEIGKTGIVWSHRRYDFMYDDDSGLLRISHKYSHKREDTKSVLRAYPNNPLYCGRLQSPMPALSAKNVIDVEKTTPGEHFWPAALASNFSLGLITTRLFG
jgi:hypothetical protein